MLVRIQESGGATKYIVHRRITDGLRIRNVDVLTVQEDGRTSLPDPLVLDRAG